MKKAITLIILICLVFAAVSGCVAVAPQNNNDTQAGPGPAAGTDESTKTTVTNGGTEAAFTEPSVTETENAASAAQTERVTEAVTENVTEHITEAQTSAETENQTEEITTKPNETEPASTERPTEPATEAPTEPVTEAPNDPPETLDVDLNSFDIELMKFIKTTQTGNYMISPLSLRYALGMLIAGASGETLNEMLAAFNMTDLGAYEEYIKQFNHFEEGFNDSAKFEENSKDPRVLRLADSVWKRSNIPVDFKEDYKLHLEMYGAEHYSFELSDVVKRVNEWASKKTEGMIPEILPEDFDTENLAIILMNALYYKSTWADQFEPECTKEGDFTKADGSKVQKEFMTRTDTYRYYSDGETTLVTVPMRGNTAVTFVFGSCDNIQDKLAKAEFTNVCLNIPKFEVETSLDNKELVNFLKMCGVQLAFDMDGADFSKMIDHEVYVNDIIQKAKIKLDEYGVEAAAVTVIDIRDKAADPSEPVQFNADRPFSFFVHTTASEWTSEKYVIMFEGEITE